MHRRVVTLSAVTVAMVTAFGLSGCAGDDTPAAAPAERVAPSTNGLSPTPTAAPLPDPDALTAVLYDLADTSVPAEQKVGLVQYATADDTAALANFGEALQGSGFAPLDVQATDLSWAGDPGHVIASVTIGSPNPGVQAFTFPMEFSPIRDTWQLSRRTADQLLPLVAATRPTG